MRAEITRPQKFPNSGRTVGLECKNCGCFTLEVSLRDLCPACGEATLQWVLKSASVKIKTQPVPTTELAKVIEQEQEIDRLAATLDSNACRDLPLTAVVALKTLRTRIEAEERRRQQEAKEWRRQREAEERERRAHIQPGKWRFICQVPGSDVLLGLLATSGLAPTDAMVLNLRPDGAIEDSRWSANYFGMRMEFHITGRWNYDRNAKILKLCGQGTISMSDTNPFMYGLVNQEVVPWNETYQFCSGSGDKFEVQNLETGIKYILQRE